jgi:cobalt-zinc-cadmium efflux system outer membrane protein
VTLELGIPLEISGRRAARRRAALLTRDLAGWDYETLRLDLYAETVRRFAVAAGARERMDLAAESVRTAEQIVEVAAARVEAGKVSPVEETRARVSLASARIQRDRSEEELRAALARLAALWGHQTLEPPAVDVTSLNLPAAPPPLEALRRDLNPDLARWDTEIAQRRAELSVERRGRIPTPTASGGYRRFEGSGEYSFVGSVGVTVPLFDRRQGAVRAARYRLSRAEAERIATETSLKAELAASYSLLKSAFVEVSMLQNEVVPAGERIFRDVEEGYRLGKFGFLEVLDAQRTLTEVRSQHIDARESYYRAVADVERLTASPLHKLE